MIHRFSFPSQVTLKGNVDEERLNTKYNFPYLEHKFNVASQVVASESSGMRNTYQILQNKKSITALGKWSRWRLEQTSLPHSHISIPKQSKVTSWSSDAKRSTHVK